MSQERQSFFIEQNIRELTYKNPIKLPQFSRVLFFFNKSFAA